jgi:hypothetical protein
VDFLNVFRVCHSQRSQSGHKPRPGNRLAVSHATKDALGDNRFQDI